MVHFKLFNSNTIRREKDNNNPVPVPVPVPAVGVGVGVGVTPVTASLAASFTASLSRSATKSSQHQQLPAHHRRISFRHLFKPSSATDHHQQQPPPIPPLPHQLDQSQFEIINTPSPQRRSFQEACLSKQTTHLYSDPTQNNSTPTTRRTTTTTTTTTTTASHEEEEEEEEQEEQEQAPTHNKNPLSIITSKLTHNNNSNYNNYNKRLTHKSSIISLVDSIKSSSKLSFTPSPSTTSGQPQTNNSFALKSFRNVREQNNDHLTTSPERHHHLNPTPTNPSRPPSIASISRPSSPSSKISAAAFREARAVRNSRASISSSFSDLNLSSLNTLPATSNPSAVKHAVKHARFKSTPGRALSDYGQPTTTTTTISTTTPRPRDSTLNHHHHPRRPLLRPPISPSSRPPSLISQIPVRQHSPASTIKHHQQSALKSLDSSTNINPNHALYAENEILTPPRPAFYGSSPSRMSAPSPSPTTSSKLADYPNILSRSLNRTSAASGFYSNRYGNSSVSSIHSVPAIPVVRFQPSNSNPPSYNRGRSVTNATAAAAAATGSQKCQDSRHLDQWHSDEDEDSGTARPQAASSHQPPHRRESEQQQVADLKKSGKDDDEDEEDSVPLSKLRKKSVGSLRDASLPATTTAAAQTLARTRQQLKNNTQSRFLPPTHTMPLNQYMSTDTHSLVEDRRISSISLGSLGGDKQDVQPWASSRFSHIPPVPLIKPDFHPAPLKAVLHPHARGNSPASSSSGSASGSWSIPITPRDSMATVNSLLLLPPSAPFSPTHTPKPRAPLASCAGPAAATTAGSAPDKDAAATSQTSKNGDAGGPAGDISQQQSATQEGEVGGPWAGVRIEDLGAPAGVDQYLYAGLAPEQKIQLHQRSQMMMQMMAAQAQAAMQMHALALAATGPMPFPPGAEMHTMQAPAPQFHLAAPPHGFQTWPLPVPAVHLQPADPSATTPLIATVPVPAPTPAAATAAAHSDLPFDPRRSSS
ncbi:hypothetical protein PCANC_05564 [Puccinia coronata f. sp. avenae]|uniref:Uncharacterized protein n=1 Tax=Puccinia coronata f. sp. avenae TaxID=200324 RepID=A0A2N5VP84_9BASI|nr:hypothetical protein PCANC_05564 [Puccinia coronata f. sp. avenae]